jgi:hypothetical protein
MNLLWIDWLSLKVALIWKVIMSTTDRQPIVRWLLRSRKDTFQARSAERDSIADNDAVRSVAAVIDSVLEKAEAERAGLKNRIDDVLSVAAIVGGNDIDDYLTRTEDRVKMLNESDAEIRRGQERLTIIEQNISHFKFLRVALLTRFPDLKL